MKTRAPATPGGKELYERALPISLYRLDNQTPKAEFEVGLVWDHNTRYSEHLAPFLNVFRGGGVGRIVLPCLTASKPVVEWLGVTARCFLEILLEMKDGEKMKLETAEGIYKDNVVKSDIIQAFQDDKGRGNFIVLSQSDQVYIQAAGEGYGPYSLEYRNGGEVHHFQCSRELSKPEVQSAFIEYLEGDESWRTTLEWERLEMRQREDKPWWKFW